MSVDNYKITQFKSKRNKEMKSIRFPNNEIIRALREIYFIRNSDKRHVDLANELDVNSTALSAFCSKKQMNPPRHAPDWIVFKLLAILNLKITIEPDQSVHIYDME